MGSIIVCGTKNKYWYIKKWAGDLYIVRQYLHGKKLCKKIMTSDQLEAVLDIDIDLVHLFK